MKTYRDWLKRFMSNDLCDFTLTEEGLLWLKLRSIERKELLRSFVGKNRLNVDLSAKNRMEKLWALVASNEKVRRALQNFLVACQQVENQDVDRTFERIRSNLYKMQEFHWGGDFRNSLDKAIVTRYVKTAEIVPYDQMEGICDGALREMSRGYLLNSWYDYWSSVLIENVFRRSEGVLPAPGRIKNVDFFVDDVPFDLKVTYLPKEYSKRKMRELGIAEPVSRLKRFAKKKMIPFDADANPNHIGYEIEQRIRDAKMPEGIRLLDEIRSDGCRVLEEVMRAPDELIRWLYEKQGDMRFGAENRVFLILVDVNDPRSSWKLKRNVDLIEPRVKEWVRSFDRNRVRTLQRSFSYKEKTYRTFADVIFVVENEEAVSGD